MRDSIFRTAKNITRGSRFAIIFDNAFGRVESAFDAVYQPYSVLSGESGRVLHMRFTLIFDTLFPFAYGAFFGGVLILAARGIFTKAVLAPVLALVENMQIALLLAQFPDISDLRRLFQRHHIGQILVNRLLFMLVGRASARAIMDEVARAGGLNISGPFKPRRCHCASWPPFLFGHVR